MDVADKNEDLRMIKMALDKSYLKRLGARLHGEANDLKRTPEALAADLSWNPDLVLQVLDGRADIEVARSLMMDIANFYPVSLADIWVEPDDTDQGVKIMSAELSAGSPRIFSRLDSNKNSTPYYEYRDTAMSSGAPFKPEWIKELRFVENSDPDNPDVAFNSGHLMHQLTFFIGEVNFYWIADGKKHCSEMNTGDSCYITPFTPHSFTSRSTSAPGLIIAITYGGAVRHALEPLSHLGPEKMEELAGNLHSPKGTFEARLKRLKTGKSLCEGSLGERLKNAGVEEARAAQLARGLGRPTEEEERLLATALGVHVKEIMVTPMESESEVVVRHCWQTSARTFPRTNSPAYRISDMASTPQQPGLCGMDLEIIEGSTEAGIFDHPLHEYIYNYGPHDIFLNWNIDRKERLRPGDSAYIRPAVSHWLTGDEGARAAIARVPGITNSEVFDEYAAFNADGRKRVLGETKKWF